MNRFLIIMLFIMLPLVTSGSVVFGQTNTTPVLETTTQPSPPPVIDASTATGAGIAGAGALIAIVKQVLDQRKNTRRDRTTDEDAGRFIILISKFYQAKYLYPKMTDREILDLPISNNPMSKQTLGQAITAEAELWSIGNQQYWNIPSPQMSVPTLTTVEAVKGSTAGPTTQPPPPGNVTTSQETT